MPIQACTRPPVVCVPPFLQGQGAAPPPLSYVAEPPRRFDDLPPPLECAPKGMIATGQLYNPYTGTTIETYENDMPPPNRTPGLYKSNNMLGQKLFVAQGKPRQRFGARHEGLAPAPDVALGGPSVRARQEQHVREQAWGTRDVLQANDTEGPQPGNYVGLVPRHRHLPAAPPTNRGEYAQRLSAPEYKQPSVALPSKQFNRNDKKQKLATYRPVQTASVEAVPWLPVTSDISDTNRSDIAQGYIIPGESLDPLPSHQKAQASDKRFERAQEYTAAKETNVELTQQAEVLAPRKATRFNTHVGQIAAPTRATEGLGGMQGAPKKQAPRFAWRTGTLKHIIDLGAPSLTDAQVRETLRVARVKNPFRKHEAVYDLQGVQAALTQRAPRAPKSAPRAAVVDNDTLPAPHAQEGRQNTRNLADRAQTGPARQQDGVLVAPTVRGQVTSFRKHHVSREFVPTGEAHVPKSNRVVVQVQDRPSMAELMPTRKQMPIFSANFSAPALLTQHHRKAARVRELHPDEEEGGEEKC